jgi:hypothetical protein
MADRLTNDVAMAGDAVAEILLNPTLMEKASRWTGRHAYVLQRAVDSVMSPVIWMAAWNQAKEGGATDLDARRIADSVVRETQGSQAPEDISDMEAGTAFYRMFMQFAGYFNMNANLLGTEYVNLVRDMGLKKNAGRALFVFLFGFLAPAVVGEMIIQAFRGGPGDEDDDGYLDDWIASVFGWAPLRYATAMVPFVGQGVNAAVNSWNNKPYDDRISTAPAISMLEASVRAPQTAYKALVEDGKPSRALNDVGTALTLWLGVPVRALTKPAGYLADIGADEVEPTGPVDLARGIMAGVASPESKQ